MWLRCTVLAVALLAACASFDPRPVTPTSDGDSAAAIAGEPMWTALAARAGTAVMAHVEVVKIVYDRTGDRLYFLQSRRWPIHYDFAARFLVAGWESVADHGAFNAREYNDADRRFILGTITRYRDRNLWTFDLFAEDTLDIAATAKVFAAIRRVTFFGPALRYHPVPEAQIAAIDRVRAAMPVITTEELFAGITYQPIATGDAWGYLRIVPVGQPPPADLHTYDVVVLGTQPLELAPVAGIVTDELQAPLGHLAVLAHGRGTPDMALEGASLAPELRALEGKPVHLHVGPADYAITPAPIADLMREQRARQAKPPKLALDLADVGMPALRDIAGDDLAHFGAKTAQLARVAKLRGIRTPRAFGLPFHAYAAFMAANGLDRRVTALLADHALRGDPVRLRAALDELRAAIAAAPIPASIVDPLLARIHAVLPGTRFVRLRSSTNAEDLAGFSGAGLYRSARVDPAVRADVERGLREVWASVWTWDAFAERDWYGIDHARVAMGVLVQESIDDDAVNGVAITGNPFYEGRPAVYINAQARGGSVTSASGNEVPEQLLVYTFTKPPAVERVSIASRAQGHALLSDAEAFDFAHQLSAIHDEFVGAPVGTTKAVDVEFLVRANREIVVVQARPYRMRWAEDRRVDLDGDVK